MRCRLSCFWLVLAVCLPLPAAGADAETLLLARIPGFPDQQVGGDILRTAYATMGIEVRFADLPAKRALLESSSGHLDGEVHRVAQVAIDHPSLIRIDPPVNFIEPSAFILSLAEFAPQGWDSIRSHRIGIVRGVGSSEAGTRGMADVQAVTDQAQLFQMLQAGRFEIAVTDRFSGQVEVRRQRLADRIRVLTPPLQRIPIHHYLHRKHEQLAPRIAALLQVMEEAGDLANLRAQLMLRYVDLQAVN
jgi:polar amino acid transport system substrate-binding protein